MVLFFSFKKNVIGLCWYEKGTNNKWTYDLIDHLMINLETIILVALACMTIHWKLRCLIMSCIQEVKKSWTALSMDSRGLHFTYDRG
jgi:hypothetical protein